MKAVIERRTWVTETIEVPKEWEFYFFKDFCDWTTEECELFDDKGGLGFGQDDEVFLIKVIK